MESSDPIIRNDVFREFVDRRVKIGCDYWQITEELKERYPDARLTYAILIKRLKCLGYKPPARWRWNKTCASSRRKVEEA